MSVKRQFEIEHARRVLKEPCHFCGGTHVELWYDPAMVEWMRPFQVRCRTCGACGPWCDCGDESAVPSWLMVVRRTDFQIELRPRKMLIATARAEALEEAATWHDEQAAILRRDARLAREARCGCSDSFGDLDYYASIHEANATAIRSLKDKPHG